MNSSTARSIRPSKSSISQSRCSGLAASAIIACVVVCLVVSLPAEDSRIRNAPISSSVSRCPSTSALTMLVIRSSPGLARRNLASSTPVLLSSIISLMVSCGALFQRAVLVVAHAEQFLGGLGHRRLIGGRRRRACP